MAGIIRGGTGATPELLPDQLVLDACIGGNPLVGLFSVPPSTAADGRSIPSRFSGTHAGTHAHRSRASRYAPAEFSRGGTEILFAEIHDLDSPHGSSRGAG